MGHQAGGGKQGPVQGHELEQNPGKPRTAHSRTRFGLREPGRSRWSWGSADRARGFPSGARLLSPGWETARPGQRRPYGGGGGATATKRSQVGGESASRAGGAIRRAPGRGGDASGRPSGSRRSSSDRARPTSSLDPAAGPARARPPPPARLRPLSRPRPLELRSRLLAAPPAHFVSRSGPAPSPGPALRAALALRPRPLAAPPARSVSRRPGPPAGKQPREERPRRPAPRSHPPPRLAAASAPCSGPALRLTFSRGPGARRSPTAPAASPQPSRSLRLGARPAACFRGGRTGRLVPAAAATAPPGSRGGRREEAEAAAG